MLMSSRIQDSGAMKSGQGANRCQWDRNQGWATSTTTCRSVYSRFHFYRFLSIPIHVLPIDSRFRFFYRFLQSILDSNRFFYGIDSRIGIEESELESGVHWCRSVFRTSTNGMSMSHFNLRCQPWSELEKLKFWKYWFATHVQKAAFCIASLTVSMSS